MTIIHNPKQINNFLLSLNIQSVFTLFQLSYKSFIVYLIRNSNKTHTLQLVNAIVVVVAIYLLKKTESFV